MRSRRLHRARVFVDTSAYYAITDRREMERLAIPYVFTFDSDFKQYGLPHITPDVFQQS